MDRNNRSFRSRTGSANLTADIFLFKKPWNYCSLHFLRVLSVLALVVNALPGQGHSQLVFDWPIRAVSQPEAVITGAGAVFWNPGSISRGSGADQEIWLTHVDGPDATGIRGVAVAGIVDLPFGLRSGVGYWHLGIPDIPRTTESPHHDQGSIEVAEDVLILTLAGDLEIPAGVGGGLRIQRGSAAGEIRSRIEGDLGFHVKPNIPLSPSIGLALRGLGNEPSILAGLEFSLPPLAQNRLPLHVGYGLEKNDGPISPDQRFSLRGSWMGEFRAGVGISRFGNGDGWAALWMVGLDLGRYSFSVLREELAHDFGPVHFFRAAFRFPSPGTE